MSCNLLSLSEELLVQHILARLDLPTLRSCSSTCRHLNLTIKSSALINYLIKLQELSLIDNPAVSYDQVPLARRLEILRDYGERLGIRWKASAAVLPRHLSRLRAIKGEADIIYIPPDSSIEAPELHWTTLPSKGDQAVEWNIVRPSNPSVNIAALALSIEENDLFAFATWREAPHRFPIQIHLMQHSTQLPYPGLTSPILDIDAFRSLMGDHPVINLAIRGANLAVMVGHESLQQIMDRNPGSWIGHLSVWNWRTGEKKCEKRNIPDKDMGLVFLKEDILLRGSSLGPSLNIYHIPTSAPSDGNYDLRLIECLRLPRLKNESYDPIPAFNLDISFAEAVPSFMESFNPTVPRLFTANSLASILTIKTVFDDESCTSFLFITHHQTLLDRAARALSRHPNGQGVIIRPVAWEDWGPDVTRLFWSNHDLYLAPFDASCGSRLFVRGLSSNLMEVYDFGRVADSTNGQIQGPAEESQTPGAVRWIVDQDDDDPECQGNWFQDVVHTKLPFVRQTFNGSVDGDWDTMYVDQSRIVGIKDNDRIDVLYIG